MLMLMLMRRRKIIHRWVNRFSGFTKRGAGGWLAIVSAVAYRLRSSVLVNVLFCGKSLGKKEMASRKRFWQIRVSIVANQHRS